MNHAAQGLIAKHQGQRFENLFESACKLVWGMACTRIPDSCRQLGARKIVRTKSPFDWVVSWAGKSAMIDTKSSHDHTLEHSKLDHNQINAMLRHEMADVHAGYVVWLRKSDRVIFVPAGELTHRMGTRGAIHAGDPGITDLGSIKTMDPRKIFTPRGMAAWMAKETSPNDKPTS